MSAVNLGQKIPEEPISVDVVPFGLARFGFVERQDRSLLALVDRWRGSVFRDRGRTWEHFTTLDCADPLDKTPRQTPDPRVEFVVADPECGELPDNFCISRYPNTRFVGDTAFISYDREGLKFPGSPRRQHVLRAIPIDWLYDDARTDLSLPNDIARAAASAKGESIED